MSAHPPTPNELSLDSNVASAIHTYRELWYVRRATDPVNERISYEVKTNALLEWRATIQQRAVDCVGGRTSEQISTAYIQVKALQERRRLDADQSLHDPIVAVLNAFSIVLDERRHPVPTGPVRSLGRSSRAPSSSLGLRQQRLYFQRRY
ncbi:uncharacterized protein RHOBADRAFT_55166 [Rhodotorula graminis WP1]|uniref:Uncharacterized protein n=1 Tax=Rhodotorula graminis (strain WP1) TaxID=578459 RepID=A0A0N8PZW0_RHOGW|nr:uncharacterized protein RHOBADRAFT_55166 [Rhodotorula graminis WP1]KPV73421.1 hypothetical protein RHOBADRAFT_55166 [Rhodotorula graminis WP1]